MNKIGSYQFEKLENRQVEAAFLSERSQLRMDDFANLLIRHGFPREGKILEVGTGQGMRARLMAETFPLTEVIGIDRSPELLLQARMQNQGLENLNFQEMDLYQLSFEDESFDFIYARLVFMHLEDPLKAIESLKRILRRGGKLLIEDADRDCMFFEPSPPSFPMFWKKVQEGQRKLGGNPNVGRMLAPYLKEMGFTNLQIEVQPIIGDGKDIQFLVRTLMPSLNLYLDIDDRKKGEEAIRDLQELSSDSPATFYHFWFVVSAVKELPQVLKAARI